MSTINRRDFLRITKTTLFWLSGLLGAAGLVRYFSYKPDPPPPTRFDVGPAEDYLVNSQTVLPEASALLIRTQAGFHAISLTCTHLGCTLKPQSDMRLTCPCHGSKFDITGGVVQGPATVALENLSVEVTSEGNLVVSQTTY